MKTNNSSGFAITSGKHKVKRSILFLLCFFAMSLLLTFKAEASHYRGGTLSWQKVSGQTNKVKFTVNMTWRSSFFFTGTPSIGATANVGSLIFGDGGSASIILKVTSVNTAEDWFYGTYSVERTYTSATATSTYIAYWQSGARISNLQNSANGQMRLETTVKPGGTNSSPVSTLPPIVNLPTNLTAATFNVPYNDPDGNNVSFRLATSAEASGPYGYTQPANFSINSSTGVATFKTTNLTVGNLYSAVVVVEDKDANGVVQTKTMVDFIIKITNQSTPPSYDYSVTPSNGYIFQTSPGNAVNFSVKASDSDPGDQVTLNAIGLPTGVSFGTSLPTTNNPVSTTFSWTPSTSQLGSNVITFTAQDINGVTTNTSITIVVSMKPLFDVPPTPSNNSTRQYEPGMNVAFKVQASDPDLNDKVKLIAIAGSPLPSGSSLSAGFPTTAANPTSTDFSWTPNVSDWGKHILKFRAEDTYSDFTDHTYSIVVNSQPYFTSTAVTEGLAGKLYSYNIISTDPDLPYGDNLEIIGNGLPAWLTLTDNGDGTATLSGTPSVADADTYDIALLVEDKYHHGYPNAPKNVQEFQLVVSACNISIASTDYSSKVCTGSNNGYINTTVTSGTEPFNYKWTGSSATSANLTGIGDGKYTVTVTDANGCTATSDTIIITTNPLPTADAGSSTEICLGEKANIGASAVSGNTYSWTSNPAGFTSTDANPEVQPSATTTYYLTETITATGCKKTNEVKVTVNPLAKITLSASATKICVDGGAITLTGKSDLTGNGVYSGKAVSSDKFDPATAGVGTHKVIFTFTTDNGCVSADSLEITVNPLANVTLADLDAVCVDAAEVTLNGSSDITTGDGVYSGNGVSGNKFNPATAGVGTHEITYTFTTNNGCVSAVKKSITVNALPSTPGLTVKDDNGNNIPNNTIFYGANGHDQANLHAQSLSNGETGKWYKGTTLLSNTKVSPTATTKYTYVVTNTSGCITTQDVTVNVADVRCGNKMDKVTICHNGHEICVAQSAVAAHLAHGCSLGNCTNGKMVVKKSSGKNEAQNSEEGLADVTSQEDTEKEAVLENTKNDFNNSVIMNGTLKLSASPNPFNSSTLIELYSSKANNISLGVYDVRGVLVSQLFNGNTSAGATQKVSFDGASLRSGIYFVRVVSGTEVQHIKLILAK